MHELKNWLDRLVKRLCEWLNDSFPEQHLLATAGNGMAGLERMIVLPVDRRIGSNVLLMAHNNENARANKASVKTGSSIEDNCGFWAYCHMSGSPCVWCGGKNSVSVPNPKLDFIDLGKKLCPKGKVGGEAWFGCCKDPKDGVAKFIAFLDCCGRGDCNRRKNACSNWPDAKNWCHNASTTDYYCTVAVHYDNDKQCK